MFETHFRRVSIKVISLVALTLLSGCANTKADEIARVETNFEDVPLLVHFDATGCPTDVSKVIESCGPDLTPLPAGLPVRPDVVCRGKGKKIFWVAVTDQAGEAPKLTDNQFSLDFTQGVEPIDKHDPKCKDSSGGVLRCTVKSDAQGMSKYQVNPNGVTCPTLDPRFYVP